MLVFVLVLVMGAPIKERQMTRNKESKKKLSISDYNVEVNFVEIPKTKQEECTNKIINILVGNAIKIAKIAVG